jgi:hypothetical protein
MAAFLDGQEVLLEDLAIRPTEHGISGRAVAFSESTVVLADFADAPTYIERGWDAGEVPSSTNTVQVWARRDLVALEMPALPGSRWNRDRDWFGDMEGEWSKGGKVRLTYAGRTEALELPLSESLGASTTTPLSASVITSLVNDLHAG